VPACEPTDEKLRRKNYKAIGLGTKVALFVVRPPEGATNDQRGSPWNTASRRSSGRPCSARPIRT